ncbi:MAG: TIGR01777 family oxidoreductase [Cytophagaceae bacterium]|nr:TIGR01777 family oxidoreductase [Cytophagaceae bacterium]MDW8456648.1 TIGR01777 family oxidoreductase [Cytophagaceae bacterium]
MNILITGGTGLIGQRLTKMLSSSNHQVAYLSRKEDACGQIKKYKWNVDEEYVDDRAFANCHCIIHLAGANVFEKKWTPSYKQEIVDSRIKSTRLLYHKLEKTSPRPNTLVAASAIGIYGYDTGENWVSEDSNKGQGFLSDVVAAWEEELIAFEKLNIRTVIIRIGIVFAAEGGAFKKLATPVKYGLGAPLGSGRQYIPWIHIEDICNIFIYALNNDHIRGIYNGVSPNPATNKQVLHEIAKALHVPVLLPCVPSYVLNIMLGKEKAQVLLGSNKVSAYKIIKAGFIFKFPNLSEAISELVSNTHASHNIKS